MQLLLISKDERGYLVKFPHCSLPHRLPAKNLEDFKAACDHWDEWSLGRGQSFSTALAAENCNKWAGILNPVIAQQQNS